MFAEFEANDDLEQGDLCFGVKVPVVTTDLLALDASASRLSWTPDLDARKVEGFYVRVTSVPLMIISQSCDLVGDDVARILVAPLVKDTSERFAARYKKAVDEAFQTAGRAFMGKGNAEPAALKANEKAVASRQSHLDDLRLGRVLNAFPVRAASGEGWDLDASICFFDNVISLPAVWGTALKRGRRLRLNPAWKSVLQESLGRWLGRFAYPGTTAQRLAVFQGDEADSGATAAPEL